MGMKNITRRFAAWIACCAMLFAALAPSMSYAMTAAPAQGWADICRASAPHAGAAPADAGHASDAMGQHCSFCATHAGCCALPPPTAFGLLPLLAGRAVYPPLFYQAPRPLPAWTAAQSRAPPQFA